MNNIRKFIRLRAENPRCEPGDEYVQAALRRDVASDVSKADLAEAKRRRVLSGTTAVKPWGSIFLAVILQCLVIYSPIRAESVNFAVIVNKANPIEDISLGELAWIYQGRKTKWNEGSEIAVINRPADSPIRADFYKAALGAEPTKKFFISGTPLPFKTIVQESDKAAKLLVARMPNAIAYIHPDEIDDSVKSIEIRGLSKP